MRASDESKKKMAALSRKRGRGDIGVEVALGRVCVQIWEHSEHAVRAADALAGLAPPQLN